MSGDRVAAIDIGTNSVLLLVAERREGGIVPVLERSTITRLGQGVDRARELHPAAVTRTLECLRAYADDLRELGVTRVDAVGTSAMRDAGGGPSFAEQAGRVLGVLPRTISGAEEARLTFHGALSGLALSARDTVVFDVGGGSTEIIARSGDGEPRGVSVDVGSVRLTERHVKSDPPSELEQGAVRTDARAALATVPAVPEGATLVGVAGTVTTLAAFVGDVAPYDARRVHGSKLAASDIARARAALASMTQSERRALPTMKPERADVIVAGALIVEEVLAAARAASIVVSDRGVRWGLASELLARL